jgi:hypothetical protein
MSTLKAMSSKRSAFALTVTCLLLVSNILFGFPADMLINKLNSSKIVDSLYLSLHDSNVVDEKKRSILPTFVQQAQAANFSIQTGYYMGNGTSQSVSGLGFQPQSVIIRPTTTAGSAVWKSSSMPASNTAFFSATANNTGTLVTLSSDGFSVGTGANVNNANIRYTWVAFAGSDCTATGTVCVGTYTGNATNPRKITTGFPPAFVMVKRSTAVAANFQTTAMGNNVAQYFTTTAQVTSGALFGAQVADGFNVGTTNNASGGLYYYIAFKAVSGIMAQGSFTGDGLDNRNISGFGAGATPNFVFVKNANNTTASNTNPVMNNTHAYGDHSSYMSATTANAVNMIQKLQSDGFQVGTAAHVNASSNTIYWVAFGGAAPPPSGSNTFEMATGLYTGNGTAQSVTGLDFSPDLVIIKDNAANQSVFRTSLMAANNTAYLAGATANFTGGITSIGSDGFSVGASATVNTSASTYQWQAFGNAYDPVTRTGAEDFAVGAYIGNGIDNRDINELPFQPDMVTVKRNSTTAATWRSSANTGDSSSFFGATAEGANRVQSLQTFGYQIGTQANVNTANSTYNWFAFKTGDNFTVGSYTGTGGAQNIATGFQPDLVWVKRTSNTNGVFRGSSLAGNATQYFGALANVTNRITGLISTGFSLTSTSAETNASGITYRYAAWRVPSTGVLSFDIVDDTGTSVSSPNYAMPATNFSFGCNNTTGTLGTNTQRLRISNTTASPAWSLSIAATDGSTALWHNSGNTQFFDFNDSSGAPSGCTDGGDADSRPGQLTITPTSGTNTPQSGCTATNVSFGGASGFQQGVTDSVTLASAGSSADTGCYWDLTNLGIGQYIPSEQQSDTYTINLTLTVTAL